MGLASTYAALNRAAIDPAAIRALTAEPWAISDAGRRQVLALVTQAINSREPIALRGSYATTVRDSVAVIPLRGPLSTRGSFFSSMLGFCDYESTLRDLTTALADVDVRAIVFDVDSPGGVVNGVHDLALAVRNARGKKPMVAFAGGTCASAAYWIASACSAIYASPTAQVGCIGVLAGLVDDSELMAKLGVEQHVIVSEQSPLKVIDPASEADRKRVQTWVTDQATVFIADIAAGRGRTTGEVEAQFGRGDLLIGGAAQKAGLVDSLGDLEDAIAAALYLADQAASGASTKAAARVAAAQAASAPVAAAPRVVAQTSKSPTKASKSVTKGSTARAVTPRANKETAMADIEKLRDIAAALHGAAQDDHEDGKACAVALAPHMKAMHAEMGEHSPFSDDDGDEDGAKALIAELGGSPKAAAGAIAALKEQAADAPTLRKQNGDLKARLDKIELKALLDEAMVEGRISKAQRAGLEKSGIEFARGFIALQSPKAAAAVAPTSEQTAQEHAKKSIASAQTVGTASAPVDLSPVEKQMAQRAISMGRVKSFEEYAALRDQVNAERMAPQQKSEEV